VLDSVAGTANIEMLAVCSVAAAAVRYLEVVRPAQDRRAADPPAVAAAAVVAVAAAVN